MRRTNTFIVRPSKAEESVLYALLDNSARLYNELNYKRRQSFFVGKIDWDMDDEYNYYKKLIGSATAQQIASKNTEAWKSFFALLKKWNAGKLKANKPRPPGYWKDRRTGNRILRTIIRNDSYSFAEEGKYLNLPFKQKLKWRGNNKWEGKQGRLEIAYDTLKKVYRCYMPVEVESPQLHQPIGNKVAYIDLGVKCPIVVNIEGNVFGYKANHMLADWWYWTHEIASSTTNQQACGSLCSQRRGHGEDNALLGSDGRRLFDDENASYFSGSVVIAIACLSAKWLGLTAVSKTARAYVGFTDLAVLPFSTDVHNYLGDFIRTYMVIPLALLDGSTVNQAVSEFQSLCYEYREAYDTNVYDEFAATMANWMDWNANSVIYEGAPFTRLGDESLIVVSV